MPINDPIVVYEYNVCAWSNLSPISGVSSDLNNFSKSLSRFCEFTKSQNLDELFEKLFKLDETPDIENHCPSHARTTPRLQYQQNILKDARMKQNSWNEISSSMNSSVSDCQSRWTRLRERFVKEKRMLEKESRSGSGASTRTKFPLYQSMLFLEEHVRKRRSYTNVCPQRRTNQSLCVPQAVPNISQASSMCLSSDKQPAVPVSHGYGRISQEQVSPRCSSPDGDPEKCSEDVEAYFGCSLNNFLPLSSPAIPNKHTVVSNTQSSQSSIQQTLMSPPPSRPLLSPSPTSQSPSTSLPKNCHSQSPLMSPPPSRPLLSPSPTSQSSSTSLPKNWHSQSPLMSPPPSRPLLSPSPTSQSSSTSLPSNCHSGKIKKRKASTDLEASYIQLSQVMIQKLNTPEQNPLYDITNRDQMFGNLVASELMKIPEPEKTARKGEIMSILWRPVN